MHGHGSHNTAILSIIHNMSTTRNMTCIDLHIKHSAHTPSNSCVNEISSPSTYTNTDGYTVSYYTLCSFLR